MYMHIITIYIDNERRALILKLLNSILRSIYLQKL